MRPSRAKLLQNRLCCLFVASLHAVVFLTGSNAAASPSVPQPACTLNVRGGPTEPFDIDISCKSSGLRVSAHPELAALQEGSGNQGFAVDPTCSTTAPRGCLLTLCGNARFSGCSINGVSTARLSATLCVAGRSSVTFHNCSFTGNTALNSTLLVADTASVTLIDSSIHGSRGRYGAAVQVTGRATLHLNRSTLSSNAGQQGGALFASRDAQLVFTDSSISNNRVPASNTSLRGSCRGGGVLLEGKAQLVLSNSSFLNNSARCDVPRGGALALRNSSKVLTIAPPGTGRMADGTPRGGSVMSGNLAQSTNQLGGSRVRMRRNTDASAAAGAPENTQGTYAEVAAAAGGAIAASGNTSVVLTDVALLNNMVSGRGTVGGAGLVASAAARVELGANVLVEGNVANGTVTYGAAAWLMGQSRALLRDGVQIKGNNATGDIPNGGGVALQDSSQLSTREAVLEGNAALGPDAWGGAILAEQRSQVLLGPGTQLLNNRAFGESAKGGAAVLGGQSLANMTGVTLQGNSVGDSGANIMGGAIYTTQAAILRLNSCTLSSNVAGGGGASGGAVAADAALGRLVVSNHTLFDSNAVTGGQGKGGAVWTQVPTVINDSCSFINNTVTGDDGGGGALYASCGRACSAGGTTLDLANNITFTRNSATGEGCMGGAVFTQNAVNLTAQGVQFAFNTIPMPSSRGGFGGALEVSGNGQGVTNITGTVFDSCSAHQGGGVALEGPLAAYLTDVTITNCTTAKDGGGLFVQNPVQAVVITRVNFTGNTAGYKAPNTPDGSADPGYGGAVNAWNVPTLFLVVNSTFEDNRAFGCGGMVAGRSRMVFNPYVRVTNNTAVERGGGVCVGTGSTLRLTSADPSAASLLAAADAGVATEDEKQQLLRMVSGNNAPDGADFWWTQMCPTGFVRNADAACRPCERDTFSFSSNANDTCRPCPPGATCPGRDVLIPLPGYWHSTNYSTRFKLCPEPDACALPIPGVNNSVQACREGHGGNLCGECAPEWGLKAPFTCARCIGKSGSIAAYTAAAMALLGFTYWLWILTMSDNANFIQAILAEDVLKVLTIYAQSMYIISKAKVTWPGILRSLASPFAFAFTGGTSVMPITCLLPSAEYLSVPSPYVLLLMQLLLPLGLVGGAMLLKVAVGGVQALFGRCCARGGGSDGDAAPVSAASIVDKPPEAPTQVLMSPTRSQQLWVLFLVVMFLSYPTLVNVALSLFACHRLDAPPPPLYPEFAVANATWGYWENQMSQACYTGIHRGWALALGAPLGLLLVVIWPTYLLVLLLRKRSAEEEPRFQMLYGFIYRAFRKEREWWGAVVVLHMAILVFVSTFMSVLGAYYCTLLLSMLFGTMQGLVLLLRPFHQSRLNWLKLASMSCLWLTSNATLAFMPGPVGYSLSDNGKNVLGVFMLLVNVVFLVAACWLLFHYGIKECKVYWHHAASWVRQKSDRRKLKRSASMPGPLQGVISDSQLPQQGAHGSDAVAVDIVSSSSDDARVGAVGDSSCRGHGMSRANLTAAGRDQGNAAATATAAGAAV